MALLHARGVAPVLRLHQRRSHWEVVRRLRPKDTMVRWNRPLRCPKWLDDRTWLSISETLTLRQITFPVDIPGSRTEIITVVTTLLDKNTFPSLAFADLYRRRWHAELFLRDIKTTLGMDLLRCKTPAMIQKELSMYLIAYNLIRRLMFQAAKNHSVPVHRISFKGTLDTLSQWGPSLAAASTDPLLFQELCHAFLADLARDLLPHRPNRIEPRARKRRPKPYALLTQPRQQFKDIPHRNKYKKPLS